MKITSYTLGNDNLSIGNDKTLFFCCFEEGFSVVPVHFEQVEDEFYRLCEIYEFVYCKTDIDPMVAKLRQKMKEYSRDSAYTTVAVFVATECHVVSIAKEDFAQNVFSAMKMFVERSAIASR